ncbi:MAG: iron-containing alcohol dehydrogenase [Deltaproteobacteria bacterium]|nr:MAG: iron-containing alcohol dehydrogenase [Deltaproteobacteria bacterium]
MYQLIQFKTPSIIFGMDTISQIGQEAKKLGAGRALLVTGPRIEAAGILEKAVSFLKKESILVEVAVEDRDTPEPATTVVEEVAEIARKGSFDVIVGLGGGSILDVAKMASALLTNPGKTRDYFGKEKVSKRGKPTLIVPTTSGTGAEVTKHAIFLDRESNVKKAVASTNLLPDVAIVDPMLTVSCPPSVTASAGIDAFLHAAEPFLSKNANPMTDAMALEAISITSRWLGPAVAEGEDLEARYSMSLGSVMSGIVLNNSGTSLVHAMAYPVGGEYHTPHGVTLSALVIACFDYIRIAKQEKMVRLAQAMGEPVGGLSPREASARALDAIRYLIQSVGLPVCLKDLGITDRTKIARWAVEAHKEQRLLSRSPRKLSVEDIQKIYENAF